MRTLRRNPRPAILLSPLVALALGCSGATPPPAATDLETPVPSGVAPDGAARPDDATPRDTFATMIRDDHPYLLDGHDHRLDECWASSRSGYLVVGVRTGTGEIVLRYDVTEDPHSGWLIDAITAIPGLVLPDDQRTQPASTSSSAHAA